MIARIHNDDLHDLINTFVAESPAENPDEYGPNEEGIWPEVVLLRLEAATDEEARACVRYLTEWAEANSVRIMVASEINYVYIHRYRKGDLLWSFRDVPAAADRRG